MDERRIKRLVVLLAISLVAIFLAKYLITKTFTNLGKAAANKKPAVVQSVSPGVSTADDPLPELSGSAGLAASAAASATSEAEPASELR